MSSKGNIFSIGDFSANVGFFNCCVHLFLFYHREPTVFRVILPLPLLCIHNVFQVFIFLVQAVISIFFFFFFLLSFVQSGPLGAARQKTPLVFSVYQKSLIELGDSPAGYTTLCADPRGAHQPVLQ